MQREIEAIQMVWQNDQKKKISHIQAEHEAAVDKLENEHHLALEDIHSLQKALNQKKAEMSHLAGSLNDAERRLHNADNVTEELRTLKIAYEKMVSAKDKEIKEVEERLDEMMKSQSGADIHRNEENRVQTIVAQHQKEIKVLQTQYQQLLDIKDREIEGFSYRLKTITTTQQKDLERLNEEHKEKMAKVEKECQLKEETLKNKALEVRWMTADMESAEEKLKSQEAQIQQKENENNQLQKRNLQLKEENEQMLRQV
ncbi:hypothetical protein BDB01DRAFT_726458 [Pilobolus umbonatus]|nr:hypothetical protein BDB01DRAFT_726458 [Pilobolus umbonatus]